MSGSTDAREDLQMKMAGFYAGALTSNLIILGDKLGLYAALSQLGRSPPATIAAHLSLNERYVAEWCRQQAASGLLSCDDTASEFWLTPAQEEVLVREYGPDASPYYYAGGFEALLGMNKIAAEQLPGMFKSGAGLAYDGYKDGYNDAIACGTCRELGVWLRHSMINCLSSIPGLEAQLQKGIAVADIGCGCGEAILTAAAAFPNSTFHGYDTSERALAHARSALKHRGLTNAEFRLPDVNGHGISSEPHYELCMTHDAIHDMAHPQKVMASVRKAIKPGGLWVIGDMGALGSHGENVKGHPLAGMLYGASCHLCLPSALSSPGGAGLGTLGLSQELMAKFAEEARFASCEVLDWDHPINRYYLLRA